MPYGDYRDRDYTKYRSSAAAPVTNDKTLKLGRKDPTYVTAIEATPTVSGVSLRSNYR